MIRHPVNRIYPICRQLDVIWQFVRKYTKGMTKRDKFVRQEDDPSAISVPRHKIPRCYVCPFSFDTVQCFRLSIKLISIRTVHFHAHQYGYIHRVSVTLLINDYQFNINSISMYYNQTILNSDRYSLYITIIKSDNNMTTEALKHYKREREK
ncbi:hypothetical protein P5V15_004533 [Pogonomyrmex californicus]